jgi:hypothetical protein
MTLGHLGGWNVRKAPVTATEIHDDGVTALEVPGAFATAPIHRSPGAGVVGGGYTPQNELRRFLNLLADESARSTPPVAARRSAGVHTCSCPTRSPSAAPTASI